MSEQEDYRLLADAAVLHLEGKPQEALEVLQRAAESAEEFTDLYAAMGLIHFELKHYEAALECYSKLLDFEPQQKSALFNEAVCLERLGRWGESRETYESVLATDPDRAEAHLGLGSCLLHLGRYANALATFESCLALSPGNKAALLGRAVALQFGGQLEEAEDAYGDVLAANPDCEEALSNLIAIGVQRKDVPTVRENAERLLRIRPRSSTALAGLAAVAFANAEFEEAALFLRDLLEIAPDDVEARFNLGVAYQKLGRLAEAVEAGGQVLALGTSYTDGYSYFLAADSALANTKKAAAIADYLHRYAVAEHWAATHTAIWAQDYATANNITLPLASAAVNAAIASFVQIGPNQYNSITNEAVAFTQAGLLTTPVDTKTLYTTKFNKLVATFPKG